MASSDTAEVRALVARALRHDALAVRELIERHQGLVFSLCLRMLGQRQDAEDVTQEVFVRAIRSLARWDAEREFKPWLLAIAGNRCRTSLSARKRRMTSTELVEEVPDRTPDDQPAQNLAEEVQLALAGIRAEYRQAFVLFHEHEMSYAEIAVSLDCPLGTVKTWVHRARRELIDRLRQRGIVYEVRHDSE